VSKFEFYLCIYELAARSDRLKPYPANPSEVLATDETRMKHRLMSREEREGCEESF
jgi:hypothetical protein